MTDRREEYNGLIRVKESWASFSDSVRESISTSGPESLC